MKTGCIGSDGRWLLALVVIISGVFCSTIVGRTTLVPADLFYNLMLPDGAQAQPVQVQNHYAMDALCIDYPWAVFWQATVRSGDLPLWNPHVLGGFPHMAESMASVFNPFKLLLVGLSAERAFSLGYILSLVLAGVWMFLFLREVGRSQPAAMIGALAWALNSSLLMWYWRAPQLFCWVPLILLLVERSIRQQSWCMAGLAGLAFGGAALSGNIQAILHLAILYIIYGLGMLVWRNTEPWGLMLLRVAVPPLLGLLLSAVHWLPTLELMKLDAYGSAAVRGTHASLRHTLLGFPALITFLFPALTGSNETYDLLKLAQASRADFTGYIGLLAFLLACCGAVSSRDWRVRTAIGGILLVVALLLLTPLVKQLYHRFFVVAVFWMSLLAAYGADALLDPAPEAQRRTKRIWLIFLVMSAAVVTGVFAIQLCYSFAADRLLPLAHDFINARAERGAFSFRRDWLADRVPQFFHHYRISNIEFWLPVLCLGAGAAAWFAHAKAKLSKAWLVGIVVCASALDVAVLGYRLVPQCDLAQYPLPGRAEILRGLPQGDNAPYRVQRWGELAPFILRPNLFLAAGADDLWGNFSMAPLNLDRLPYAKDGAFTRWLDILNVKYLYADAGRTLPAARFTLIEERGGVRIWRNENCLPRARIYYDWRVLPGRDEVLEQMRDADFDPARTMLLEQTPPLAPSPTTAARDAQVVSRSANKLQVHVADGAPGMLLLAETWYPGWIARLNGHTTELYRANAAMRAVVVPAGEHLVEFSFEPVLLRFGMYLGIAGLAGVVLLGFARPSRR